ncbi:MAG: MerR family transcriptional regulator, partial [Alphaproteobacteria bacterium]|nr:MerR family transcriptional regulator [Alphaproteobacteria bacterium]
MSVAEPSDSDARGRPARKSATAYRTISEVSEALDVPQHVLRFWETKFTQVRPLKRGGGRRYYRPEDIQLLQKIQTLLYEDGYTIKGVQRLLREGKVDDDRDTAVETVADLFGTEDAPGGSAGAGGADGGDGAAATVPPG